VPGTLRPGVAKTGIYVSCGGVGNCAAGGWYLLLNPTRSQAFVADEKHGVWGKAHNVSGISYVQEVSCASAGNCAAIDPRLESLVVDEKNGVWGTATPVTR
jgi:hypothetical protein